MAVATERAMGRAGGTWALGAMFGAALGFLVPATVLAEDPPKPFPEIDWTCYSKLCEKRQGELLTSLEGVFEGGANLHTTERADEIAALKEQGIRSFEVAVPSTVRLKWSAKVDRDHMPENWPKDIGLGNTSVDVAAFMKHDQHARWLKSGDIVPAGASIRFEVQQETYGLSGSYVTYYPAKWSVEVRYHEIKERGIAVFRDGRPVTYYKRMPLNQTSHPAEIFYATGDVTVIQYDDGSATVITGDDGRAAICWERRDCMKECCGLARLNPNTRLDLGARNMGPQRGPEEGESDRLSKGTVFYQIFRKALKQKDKVDWSFGVETPMAVAGVRGTEFDLNVQDNGTTTLHVVEGEVSFTPKALRGDESLTPVIVGAGQKAASVVRGEMTLDGIVQYSELMGPATWERPISSVTGEPHAHWWEWSGEDGAPWQPDFSPPYKPQQIADFTPPLFLSSEPDGGVALECAEAECLEPDEDAMQPDWGPTDPPLVDEDGMECEGAECREPDDAPSDTHEDGTPVQGDPIPQAQMNPVMLYQKADEILATIAGQDPATWPAAAAPAIDMLNDAANAGYAPALMSLAYIHEAGMGVPQDFDAAISFYREAGVLGMIDGFFQAIMLADQTARDDGVVQSFVALYKVSPFDGLQALEGASPEARIAVQRFLQGRGTYTGALDGKFGNGSVAALDAYLDGAAAPVMAPEGELVRDMQVELKRLGCYDKDVDGDWGAGSVRAMTNFNHWAGTAYPADMATPEGLSGLRAHPGPVCGVD